MGQRVLERKEWIFGEKDPKKPEDTEVAIILKNSCYFYTVLDVIQERPRNILQYIVSQGWDNR